MDEPVERLGVLLVLLLLFLLRGLAPAWLNKNKGSDVYVLMRRGPSVCVAGACRRRGPAPTFVEDDVERLLEVLHVGPQAVKVDCFWWVCICGGGSVRITVCASTNAHRAHDYAHPSSMKARSTSQKNWFCGSWQNELIQDAADSVTRTNDHGVRDMNRDTRKRRRAQGPVRSPASIPKPALQPCRHIHSRPTMDTHPATNPPTPWLPSFPSCCCCCCCRRY